MTTLMERWFGRPLRRPARGPRRRLGVEALEDRTVPTVLIQPHFPGVTETSPASNHQLSLQSEPVVLIFAGSYWGTAQGAQDQTTLTNSIKTLVASPYLSATAQYGGDGKASYYASANEVNALALTEAGGNQPNGAALLAYVQAEANAHPEIVPDWSDNPQTSPLYVVINDPAHSGPNSSVVYGQNWTDGWTHAVYVGTRTFGGPSVNVDVFTQVFSHELAEATASYVRVSDPGNFNLDSQIADNEAEAAQYTGRVNGVQVQAYWSALDRAWIIPDGSATDTVLKPVWTNGHFTGQYTTVATNLPRPAAGSGVTVAGRTSSFVITAGGALWQHTGTDSSLGWTLLKPNGVTAVSAGVDGSGKDTAFVKYNGALWLHTGTNAATGWSQIWANVSTFEASQRQANTVFVSFDTDLWKHTGTNANTGWTQLLTGGVTGFSAGVDAAGKASVFVNFGGQLWLHTGTNANTGWSQLAASGVTAISASQAQANTVFVSYGSNLWKHTGTSSTSGWTLLISFDAVTAFSAGVDAAGAAAVFVNIGGALWEYANSGNTLLAGGGVTAVSASHTQSDLVFVALSGSLRRHKGLDPDAGWLALA